MFTFAKSQLSLQWRSCSMSLPTMTARTICGDVLASHGGGLNPESHQPSPRRYSTQSRTGCGGGGCVCVGPSVCGHCGTMGFRKANYRSPGARNSRGLDKRWDCLCMGTGCLWRKTKRKFAVAGSVQAAIRWRETVCKEKRKRTRQ
ncbi:hypothetical protein DL89DRAFT_174298 [Linderina pennispora]|uniref:Uncharacterized protein n=1 Tax=Linderina pennispora TaxID=61395 RepID=A0A1Y1W7C8_9FUNG|nr:uncharacterized protein DL89DRAFT_174298 [Linderina pennispora]ORX69285.1 hypothetical protein DL89DRAFT_174298 [Linderina pennispora]